jgi:orotate phosphoribosyltransferase-like protein
MGKFYKRYFFTAILITSMLTGKAQALEDVVNSIRTSNITSITRYFDKFVSITIANNQSMYSKTQAEMVLKDFFAKNPVKEFVVVQQGSTQGNNSTYAIGNLTTTTGSYQLYVVLKLKEGAHILQEIRFEKQKP